MARNCEKKLIGLNRMWLEKQQKVELENAPKRPYLNSLHSASEVKKWIPGLKREIDYYLDQLAGARQHRYPDTKVKEFESKVENLEKEYKRFVRKVFELDPSTTGVPWQPRGYVSKRKNTQSSEAEAPTKKICTPLLEKESQTCPAAGTDTEEVFIQRNHNDCDNQKNLESDVSLEIKDLPERSESLVGIKPLSILGLDYDSSSDSDVS